MEVVLANPRGFCAGVERAVHAVRKALEMHGPPVYVKHQVVHNPTVVQELEQAGAVTVERVEQVPEGANVVFSAHGSPPSDFATARQRNLHVIDATCPLVTRVHNEAKKYSREGRRIILIGHRGHQEVIGSQGYADMHLMDDREPFSLPDWPAATPVAILTQTTLSVDDTARAIKAINGRFTNVVTRNDICYATTNRQEAVKKLVEQVDVVVVIGSSTSSNCVRLKELAESCGVKAYRVTSADELKLEWFDPAARIGVTSSASTPERAVAAVLKKLGPRNTTTIGGDPEKVVFSLPQGVR